MKLRLFTNVVILVVASGWVSTDFGWESAAFFVVALLALVVQVWRLQPRHVKESDVRLFEEFLRALPSKYVTRFLDQHDFGNSCRSTEMNQLIDFYERWQDAEHEFQDRKLEGLRVSVLDLTTKFLEIAVREGYTEGQLWMLPKEMHVHSPDRWEAARSSLNGLSTEIATKHQELVREGRRLGDSYGAASSAFDKREGEHN